MTGEINVEHDYALGVDFEPAVLSCVLAEEGRFFERFGPAIEIEAFTSKHIAALIAFIKEYHTKYKRVPSQLVLADLIRSSKYKEPGSLVNIIENLPVVPDQAYVADRILKWVKWRAIDQALADESLRSDPRAFSQAVEQASRQGDALLMDHTKLEEDRPDEDVRDEVIECPWRWVNDRLLGGPVRKDLCIVMTVINGGKTTVLTNVAGHSVAQGKHVVYFTFEDGESKIKRRQLQWINGWTTEEIIADLAEARRKRDRFLQLSGGQMHIKQLKSRRTTVDEALAFVKNIEEVTQRKVDTVITDYADRFRAQNKYSEPRHALREIYEDCKYMASDLNVVHWTASQINKTKTGKDVVGIEDGSESTGKFESCDLALGFGQTLEDGKIGRITCFTSKVRDGAKNEMCSFIADFDTQRIYETDNELMKPKRKKK